eukprot:NODE_8076_length_1525_cov_4.547926.p1 GENE.NODE_8076_length_1525_cov_4.547926~~NODE_8076_length_1525_cov_4.547926.p1  ORF type:complete len:390 (-),score=125.38 NODE_8076_length_1525_cov_4.547926:356-1423(-)
MGQVGSCCNKQWSALVLGGTGLLGRPVLDALGKRGVRVTVVSSRAEEELAKPVAAMMQAYAMCYVQMDASQELDNALVAKLFREHDVVLNLIGDRGGCRFDGRAGVRDNWHLNVDLPLLLAAFAQELETPLIQLSADVVWNGAGNTEEGYPATAIWNGGEGFVVEASCTAFAWQKRSMEEKLSRFERVSILRVPTLYGPMLHKHEDSTCSQAIVDYLTANSMRHDIWQRRYPTDVRDVAAIVAGLMRRAAMSPGKQLPSRVYHYGAEACLTKHDFMTLFSVVAGLANARRVIRDNVGERPPNERPAKDVKLNNAEIQRYLGREFVRPRALTKASIEEVWLPYVRESIQAVMSNDP